MSAENYTKPTHPRVVDLTGKRFDRLTVVSSFRHRESGRTYYVCKCSCGSTHEVMAKHIVSGKIKSCGCLKREVAAQTQRRKRTERIERGITAKPNDARFIDLTGDIYGRLQVIEFAGRRHNDGVFYWLCKCSCGNTRSVKGSHLRSGAIQSCGCLLNEARIASHTTHGDCKKRIYWEYRSILQRCIDPNSISFKNYGGRGITLCDEWISDYVAFRDWALGNGYSDDLTIERKDVDGPYSPGNCCWIPLTAQARNKRNTLRVEAFGESRPLKTWTEDVRCVVSYETARCRLARGWPAELALTMPPLS